jgi:hypothetical protein
MPSKHTVQAANLNPKPQGALPEANQANTENQRAAANAPSIEPQRTNTNTMQARGHANTREKQKDGSG